MRNDLNLFVDLVEKLLIEEDSCPVVKPISNEDLYSTLDITLGRQGMVDDDFSQVLQDLVLSAPRTATKMFFNQLFGGRNSRAVLGDLLSVMLNNSMYTYKVGGPMIGVEKEIIKHISLMIGYNLNACDGTLAPGGSMTNLMGLLMARDAKDPHARTKGVSGGLTVYTSAESHYSVSKNMAFVGLGRDALRYIPTDHQGSMDIVALDEMIRADKARGLTPCMVNATSGTTVLGAFDPLRSIGEICKKYNIWFHVDGAYCGSVMFSDKYKKHIDGSEMADSFTLNAHKMLATPLACSIIVVKDKQHLYDTFSNEASYLYQTADDEYNPGKISLQCGRRNDALKFWTLWKSIGSKGLEKIVDHQFELGAFARDYVADHPHYTLYNSGDSVAVCFNYKDIDPKILCNSLYDEGEIMVGFGSFGGNDFVRLVTVNSGNSKEDIIAFFNKLEAYADSKLMATIA